MFSLQLWERRYKACAASEGPLFTEYELSVKVPEQNSHSYFRSLASTLLLKIKSEECLLMWHPVRPLIGLFHTEHAVLNKSLYIKTLMFLYVKRLLSFLEPLNIPYLKKRNMELLQPCNTTWTGESLYFFSPFFSLIEKERQKTQGPNPQSTQSPFMGVLGETFICPFLSRRKRGFKVG